MPKKILFFVVLIFSIIFLYVNQTQSQESAVKDNKIIYQPVEKFDAKRDAIKDIEEAIQEATKTEKRILLKVGGDWCSWCRRLNAFLKEHESIKNLLEHNFILVAVNYSKENKNEKVLSGYPKIKGFPHIFVLEKDGKLLYSKDTGELEEESSYSEQKILEFLKEWKIQKK